MRPLALLFLLAACAPKPKAALPPQSAPIVQECPEPKPVVIPPPRPVWPDSCVADWYARASLPLCVEAYLGELKAQQKTIARKRRGR